jgi:hypothetical protein
MTSPNAPQPDKPEGSEPRILNSRADLRDLLVDAGLARGAAEKIATGGWPALAGEPTETDLIEEAATMARDLSELFRR